MLLCPGQAPEQAPPLGRLHRLLRDLCKSIHVGKTACDGIPAPSVPFRHAVCNSGKNSMRPARVANSRPKWRRWGLGWVIAP